MAGYTYNTLASYYWMESLGDENIRSGWVLKHPDGMWWRAEQVFFLHFSSSLSSSLYLSISSLSLILLQFRSLGKLVLPYLLQ